MLIRVSHFFLNLSLSLSLSLSVKLYMDFEHDAHANQKPFPPSVVSLWSEIL